MIAELQDDPAVRTAAVALQLGWSDPWSLLRLDADDWTVAVAVVNAAAEDRAERLRELLDAAGVVLQNAVVRAFGGGRQGSGGGWVPEEGDD